VSRSGQEGTKGIWAWSELIEVPMTGTSGDFKLMVIDTEGLYKGRPELTAVMFTVAALLSSHLIYFSLQTISRESFGQLSFLADLPTIMRAA
jgi:hypothetical protein